MFLTPEKVKNDGAKLLLDHYTKMLGKFGGVEFIWTGVKKGRVRNSVDHAVIVNAESAGILKTMERTSSCVKVVFDERGEMLSSVEFAKMLSEQMRMKGACIMAVVGGAYGVNREVRNRADLIISFSKMTFPHELALVMAVEQIYRAMTILKGEKYHH